MPGRVISQENKISQEGEAYTSVHRGPSLWMATDGYKRLCTKIADQEHEQPSGWEASDWKECNAEVEGDGKYSLEDSIIDWLRAQISVGATTEALGNFIPIGLVRKLADEARKLLKKHSNYNGPCIEPPWHPPYTHPIPEEEWKEMHNLAMREYKRVSTHVGMPGYRR